MRQRFDADQFTCTEENLSILNRPMSLFTERGENTVMRSQFRGDAIISRQQFRPVRGKNEFTGADQMKVRCDREKRRIVDGCLRARTRESREVFRVKIVDGHRRGKFHLDRFRFCIEWTGVEKCSDQANSEETQIDSSGKKFFRSHFFARK